MESSDRNFPNISHLWPGWTIVRRLGRGSYGSVYEANYQYGEIVNQAAIKVVEVPTNREFVGKRRAEGFSNQEIMKALEQERDACVSEIRCMMELQGQSNVVYIYDFQVVPKENEMGWNIWIRMELLHELSSLSGNHFFEEYQVLRIGQDICTALKCCHETGFMHRDVKPSNILWNDKLGQYKLADFGIARSKDNTSYNIAGTYEYMAPEVINGEHYDNRVDIYSLGMVMYYFLNENRGPFINNCPSTKDIENAYLRRVRDREPLPPLNRVSRITSDIILRACESDPARRFANAEEFLSAINYAMHALEVAAGEKSSNSSGTVYVNRMISEPTPSKPMSVESSSSVADNHSENPKEKTNSSPKKNLKLLLVTSVLALLVVAGIGIFAWVSLNKKSKDEDGGIETFTIPSLQKDSSDSHSETEEVGSTDSEETDIASAIKEADQLAANGDYDGAIARIKTEMEKYSQSEELKNKLNEYTDAKQLNGMDDILRRAQQLADQGNYNEAIRIIEEARKTDKDNEDLAQAYAKYYGLYQSQILEETEVYANNGDFENAILTIREAQNRINPEAFTTALTQYEDSYRTALLQQAEAVIPTEGYEKAKSILEGGLTVLPDDVILQEKIKEYEKYSSAQLLNMPVLNYESRERINSNINKVNYSNQVVDSNIDFYDIGSNTQYTYGWELQTVSNSGIDNKTIDAYWKLEGTYDTLSGKLICGKDSYVVSGQDEVNRLGGRISVYNGDTSKLLYASPLVNSSNGVVPFNVNISGVTNLYICFTLYPSVTKSGKTTYYEEDVALCDVVVSLSSAGSQITYDNNGDQIEHATMGFIFPDSDTRELSQSEIQALSNRDVRFAINEIWARKGYIFENIEVLAYFRQFEWYQETVPKSEWERNGEKYYLNSVELQNSKNLDAERQKRKKAGTWKDEI